MRPTIVLSLLFCLQCGSLGAAAELPSPLKACAAIRADAERLACFDRAVAQMEIDGSREELEQISASVTSLQRSDDGTLVLLLDNGQVWRQSDANVSLTIDSGDSVTVVRASLGTFRITDKRGRSARFKRVR
jgi:hypothetical protein